MSHQKEKIEYTVSTGTILRVFVVAGLVLALYMIRDLILVVLTSITIASFVEAGIARMKKWGLGRTLSGTIIYFITLSFLFGLFYFFIPIVIDEVAGFMTLLKDQFGASDLFTTLPAGDTISEAQNFVSGLSQSGGTFSNLTATAQSLIGGLSGGFVGTLSFLFGGLVNLILIIIISFYLSVQENGIENFLRIIIPLKHEDYVVNLWHRTERKIGLWFQGQMLLGLIIGILTYIGLLLLGVPYALLLSLLTAVFELVPFGIVFAIIPAVSFAYFDGGVSLALLVFGLYTVLHQLENYFIQPLVVRRVIGISPLVVILSVLIGSQLAGFWGFVLAIPVAVCVLEFMSDVEKDKIFAKSNPK